MQHVHITKNYYVRAIDPNMFSNLILEKKMKNDNLIQDAHTILSIDDSQTNLLNYEFVAISSSLFGNSKNDINY